MYKLPELPGDELREVVLRAVQEDRWVPILHPPYDHTAMGLGKAVELTKVSNILGPLAVATHEAYKIYRNEHTSLLKRDEKEGKFQYLYPASNPNYYYLVFLKGTTPNKSKRELICQTASFVLIPEALKEISQAHFIRESNPSSTEEGPNYTPKFRRDGYTQDIFIASAKEATTLVFNERGNIKNIGFYIRDQKELFVASYSFDLENGNVRFSRYSAHPGNWDFSNAWATTSFFLHQDGLLRSAQGEVEETPLDEALAAIAIRIPLEHYIK